MLQEREFAEQAQNTPGNNSLNNNNNSRNPRANHGQFRGNGGRNDESKIRCPYNSKNI
jgi:hypothetical protein